MNIMLALAIIGVQLKLMQLKICDLEDFTWPLGDCTVRYNHFCPCE